MEAGSSLASNYLSERRASVFGTYMALDDAKVAQAPAADREVLTGIQGNSKKSALQGVAILPTVMLITYLLLMMYFRVRGGYRPVVLGAESTT